MTDDELTAAMALLASDGDFARSDLNNALVVILAALEHALPLLPLADVIERLEAHNAWSLSLWKSDIGSALRGAKNYRAQAYGNNFVLVLSSNFETTWPDAIRALAQAVESEART